MNNKQDIWFSRIDLSNKIKLNVLEKYSTSKLYDMEKEELENYLKEDIKNRENIINKILDLKYKKDLDKYEKYLNNKEIKLIYYYEKDYPKKLLNIDDKPAYIFVRGNKNILDDDGVGIVGSRKATEDGKYLARYFAKEIADKNVNIISGLAIGVDKYAHLGALDSSIGKTIAVLGTGLADNDLYPEENRKVFERILEKGGAIVSEFIIGTKPVKYNFPRRNRIISGLSDKLIVVEAKEKSGSLITAEFALEQGKEIYAIPGKINDANYVGTNKLIKDGAFLLEEVGDLFINY